MRENLTFGEAHDDSKLQAALHASALDAATEARVLDRIAACFPAACLIASVHRLSVLDHFDSIVLIEAGRVRDYGPCDAVLVRHPQLQKMAMQPRPNP